MATITEQISSLQTQVANLTALVLGARDPGKLYAMLGSYVVFGCKVTQGASSTDLILALDSAASGDTAHLNPDRSATPTYIEQYGNIAMVYGEAFYATDKNTSTTNDTNLTVTTAPGTGYHRYDIVYAYVGQTGPAVGIAAGTAVLNASTPADPSIPHGAIALARVHVEASVTGIADAKITDLRSFGSRVGTSPLQSISAAYTTVLADANTILYHPGADTSARTWTIDSNANVAYPVGTALHFVNDTSAGTLTIAITSDTLVLAGAGSTGSRTLTANGFATALKVASTRWIINGTNLT